MSGRYLGDVREPEIPAPVIPRDVERKSMLGHDTRDLGLRNYSGRATGRGAGDASKASVPARPRRARSV